MNMVHILEGAIWLKVVEVDQIIEALRSTLNQKDLSGGQRQHLEETISLLTDAKKRAVKDWVGLTHTEIVSSLECICMTQNWLNNLLSDVVKRD